MLLDSLKTALSTAQDSTYHQLIGKINSQYERSGDQPDSMMVYAQMSLERAKQSNSAVELGYGHYRVGRVYVMLGQYENSIPYFQNSIKYAKQAPHYSVLFAAYNNLRYSLTSLGEMDKALELTNKAESTADSLGKTLYQATIAKAKGE